MNAFKGRSAALTGAAPGFGLECGRNPTDPLKYRPEGGAQLRTALLDA